MGKSLRDLRKDRKLTLLQVAEGLALRIPNFKVTTSNIAKIEERGTDSYRVITALADLYQMPAEEVARAAAYKKMCQKV